MTIENGCQCCYCKHLRAGAVHTNRGKALALQREAAVVSANARFVVNRPGDTTYRSKWSRYWERVAIVREQSRAEHLYNLARAARDVYLDLEGG